MVKKEKSKKVKAAIMAGIVVLSGGAGAIGHALMAEPTQVPVEVIKEVPVEKVVEVVKEVPVNVTVEKIVEVDNGDLAFVTQRLEDKGIFEDAEEVVMELKAEDEAIALAIAKIKEDFADELEDADIVRDEEDASIVKVYSDYEDIQIVKSDFDDEEYKFVIDVKVEDDRKDTKFKTQWTVVVEDGSAEIKSVDKA